MEVIVERLGSDPVMVVTDGVVVAEDFLELAFAACGVVEADRGDDRWELLADGDVLGWGQAVVAPTVELRLTGAHRARGALLAAGVDITRAGLTDAIARCDWRSVRLFFGMAGIREDHRHPPPVPQTYIHVKLSSTFAERVALEDTHGCMDLLDLHEAFPPGFSEACLQGCLHTAVRLKLGSVAMRLLRMGVDPDSLPQPAVRRGAAPRLPVSIAIGHGMQDVACALITARRMKYAETATQGVLRVSSADTRRAKTGRGKAAQAAPDQDHNGCLIPAVEQGLDDVLALLLSDPRDVNVDTHNRRHQTALHIAAARGKREYVRALLGARADIDSLCSQKCTPLVEAVLQRQPDAALDLVRAGADVTLRVPATQKTPLHYAAEGGYSELLCAMVARADPSRVNLRDKKGGVPIGYAAEHGDVAGVAALVAAGADVNAGKPPAIVTAVLHGFTDTCAVLVAARGDITHRDASGRTLLMNAVRLGHADIAKALIAAGADTAAHDYEGFTAVQYVDDIDIEADGQRVYVRDRIQAMLREAAEATE